MRKPLILCGTSFLIGLILGVGAMKCSNKEVTASPVVPTSQDSIRTSTYQGIDVSHHQGSIDWTKVATDTLIQFVYIKATEGATHRDKLYEYNITEARSAGLRVGSYHYLRKTSGIRQQFRNFTKAAQRNLQDLIPMVDVEEEVPKYSIRLFCQLLTSRSGAICSTFDTKIQFYCEKIGQKFGLEQRMAYNCSGKSLS